MSTASYPLTDITLARRLERTEATANAAFVESRGTLEPHVGAAWIDVAGVYAMFDGLQSPLTQTFGLGLFDSVGESEFGHIEEFFLDRGAPVYHEVCPMIASEIVGQLNGRGYEPVEFSTVLVRPTAISPDTANHSITVRRIGAEEIPLWSQVAAAGWSSESAELATIVEGFGPVIGAARGAHCFIGYLNDRPIAAATLMLNTDVALLAGASTVVDARQQGAQHALLQARLHFAAAQGTDLAMMVALPGSASQRNAERQGFRPVYTRTKWYLNRSRA